ncbi:hypothetical protein E2C01_093216 [Portunus trituberculatus]|uniref:Uncharacterized protein n=1 Tax=Portunus trituberculatus TaxID=210409 RepID=A0A5B7JY07_PORTR|nr:hypothetical protein [Portunus trituberculatus]
MTSKFSAPSSWNPITDHCGQGTKQPRRAGLVQMAVLILEGSEAVDTCKIHLSSTPTPSCKVKAARQVMSPGFCSYIVTTGSVRRLDSQPSQTGCDGW